MDKSTEKDYVVPGHQEVPTQNVKVYTNVTGIPLEALGVLNDVEVPQEPQGWVLYDNLNFGPLPTYTPGITKIKDASDVGYSTSTIQVGQTLIWNGSLFEAGDFPVTSIPVATNSVLGGVKIGSGISVNGSGVISVPTFTRSTNGIVPYPGGSGTTRYLREDGQWVTPPGGGGGGGGATNLSLGIRTSTTLPILNDNGDGVTLPEATDDYAGLLSSTYFTKLKNLPSNVVDTETDQDDIDGEKTWIGPNHFTNALSIPTAPPDEPEAGKAYIWIGPGTTAEPIPLGIPIATETTLGGIIVGDGLEIDEEGVLSATGGGGGGGSFRLRANTSSYLDADTTLAQGTGITLSQASSTITVNATAYTGSNGINVTSFNISPTYGTTAGTIAQGNDSRINNGQTAFGWGNHASAGYATLATEQTISAFKKISKPFSTYNITSLVNLENIYTYSTSSISNNNYIFIDFDSTFVNLYLEFDVELYRHDTSLTDYNKKNAVVAKYCIGGKAELVSSNYRWINRQIVQKEGVSGSIHSVRIFRKSNGKLVFAIKVPALTDPRVKISSLTLRGSESDINTAVATILTNTTITHGTSLTGLTPVDPSDDEQLDEAIPKIVNSKSDLVKFNGVVHCENVLRIPTSAPSSPQPGDIWIV